MRRSNSNNDREMDLDGPANSLGREDAASELGTVLKGNRVSLAVEDRVG